MRDFRIELKNYTPDSLSKQIQDALRVGGDYLCGDYFLLLDGYDEVKDFQREILLKEINQQLSNNPYIRKVLITVRENTFDTTDFKMFEDVQSIRLNSLNKDDIEILLEKNGIPGEKFFFENVIFMSFSDNIYYVVNFIEYYKLHHSIAKDIVELFDFIIEKEVNQLFRNELPDMRSIVSLALFMTLQQTQLLEIENSNLEEKLHVLLPANPFSFSHKSIQEYLAAKKVSAQPLETIKKIFARGDLIITHLSNSFGFVLNILQSGNDQEFQKFKLLVDWSTKGKGNSQKLLKIEPDKISDDMNHKIFVSILNEEAPVCNIMGMPQGLIPFMIKNTMNIKYLVNQVLNSKELNSYCWHYYTYLLQNLTYTDTGIEKIENEDHHRLFDFFYSLLDDNALEQYCDLIDSLYFSICYSPLLASITDSQMKYIILQTLKIKNKSTIFNNLCRLIINSHKEIRYDLFIILFKYIVGEKDTDSYQIASVVPDEPDDDYKTQTIRSIYTEDFFELLEKFLSNDKYLWKFIQYLTSYVDHEIDYYDFEKLYKYIFEKVQKVLSQEGLNQKKINIFSDWIIKEIENDNLGKFWKDIHEILVTNVEYSLYFIKQIIHNSKKYYNYYRNLNDYFIETIQKEQDFLEFKKKFLESGEKSLKDFYDYFITSLPKKHTLYDFILNNISDQLKESIMKYEKDKNELVEEQEFDQENHMAAIHTVFDKERLFTNIELLFNQYDSDNLDKETFYKSGFFRKVENQYPFVVSLIQNNFRAGKNSISKNDLHKYINSPGWENGSIIHLVYFMTNHDPGFSELNDKERSAILAWVDKILTKYPISSLKPTLYEVHRIICHILRNTNFIAGKLPDVDRLMGFAYTGFPKGLEGGFIVNYDSFSIDYLEKYISTKKLIAYIVNNFSYKDLNERVSLSLTGYLNGRFNLIFPYQKDILRKKIVNYLNMNLDSGYQIAVRDLAFSLGVKLSELDKSSFIKALRIEDESLVHNYAASFILYPKDNMDNTEKDILLDYMKQSWAQSQNLFYKKIITENYLSMNKLAGDMFLFYADYLLADEKNSISNRFGSGGMGGQIATADINHLDKVKELLLYSTKKEDSERRDAISRMALESYKLIAQRATDKSELELVINSMKNIHTHGHDFILSYIREVENAFAERMYKPLSLDEVLEL